MIFMRKMTCEVCLSTANVRALEVLRPPIRALPSVIVVTDKVSGCARWKKLVG